MEVLIFWIGVNALIGYAIGKQKNEVGAAIGLSILLGPIGWLIAIVVPGKTRKCPYCAESVKPEAKVCRYCHRELAPEPVKSNAARPLSSSTPTIPGKVTGWTFAVCVAAVAAVILIALNIRTQKKPENTSAAGVHTAVTKYSTPVSARTQVAPQQSDYRSLRITKPVDLKDSLGHVVARLQRGQSLPYTYRDDYQALVRYEGRDYEIRISATDLK